MLAPKEKPVTISQSSGCFGMESVSKSDCGSTIFQRPYNDERPTSAIPAIMRPITEPARKATMNAGFNPPDSAAAAVLRFALVATTIPM